MWKSRILQLLVVLLLRIPTVALAAIHVARKVPRVRLGESARETRACAKRRWRGARERPFGLRSLKKNRRFHGNRTFLLFFGVCVSPPVSKGYSRPILEHKQGH